MGKKQTAPKPSLESMQAYAAKCIEIAKKSEPTEVPEEPAEVPVPPKEPVPVPPLKRMVKTADGSKPAKRAKVAADTEETQVETGDTKDVKGNGKSKETKQPKAKASSHNKGNKPKQEKPKRTDVKENVPEKKDVAAALTSGDLPCEVSWKNLKAIQQHFKLTEAEASSCLLAVLGPDPDVDEFWGKFKKTPEKTQPVEVPEHKVLPESSFDPSRHSSIRTAFPEEDMGGEEDQDNGDYEEGEEEEMDEDDDDVDGEGRTVEELKALVIPDPAPPVEPNVNAPAVTPKEWAPGFSSFLSQVNSFGGF